MKTHFYFYRTYYDIFKRLKYPKNIMFMDVLMSTLLEDGSGLQNAKSIIFADEELDNEWYKVISQLSKRDRNTPEYNMWRTSVFERDLFICKKCNKSGVKLNAHHIIRWADNEKLRFDINNGETLCEPCHKAEHRKDTI